MYHQENHLLVLVTVELVSKRLTLITTSHVLAANCYFATIPKHALYAMKSKQHNGTPLVIHLVYVEHVTNIIKPLAQILESGIT